MAESRPVRIVRRPREAPALGSVEGVRLPSTATGEFRRNGAGTSRGYRLFVLFSGFLLAIYFAFLALDLTSPTPGVSGNSGAYALLTVIALLFILVGYTLTLARAPRGYWSRGDEIVVHERGGRRRRFPPTPQLSVKVLQRYPSSFLGPEPTELVQVTGSDGRNRQYLVGSGWFDLVPAAPP